MHAVTQEWTEIETQREERRAPERKVRACPSGALLQTLTPCIRLTVINARLHRRWTVASLAERIGVSVGLVRDIEEGNVLPDNSTIMALEAALDVKLVPTRDPDLRRSSA